MEVLRLGVKLELQLLTYTTDSPDLSHIGDLHQSSWQCWILNPTEQRVKDPKLSLQIKD